MEKAYRQTSYFFISILLISFVGFFRSYFSTFPHFESFQYIHHLHLLSLLLWFVLLMVQPVLIYKKKVEWHRLLGKASYVLMPIIVLLMLAVMKVQYLKGQANHLPQKDNLAFLYLPVSALIPFIITYLLAIFYRHQPASHMRYIIASAVTLLGPSIGRINFGIKNITTAILFAFALSDIFLVGLLVYEFFNRKHYIPYVISLLICVFFHGLFAFFPYTNLWQAIASKLVLIW